VQPDVLALRAFLSRVGRRLTWIAVAWGAAAGLAVAVVAGVAGVPTRDTVAPLVVAGVLLSVIGSVISILVTTTWRRRTAVAVEQRTPESRNLIITAAELATTRDMEGYAPGLVFREASRLVGRLNPSVLFPARRAIVALMAVLGAWLLVVMRPGLPISATLRGVEPRDAAGPPVIDGIDVVVRPPAYTGRPAQTVRDPSRIEALAGSQISLSVRVRAERVVMETLASRDTVLPRRSTFDATIVADADGYIAIEPIGQSGAGPKRLIGLSVQPDAPPRVRIVAPGRDQRFPNGHGTLDIGIEASDDLELASLALRFTRVSGSGERFTFVEGQVPLSIARRDGRTWTARASWVLDSLKLDPGDMVVYKAIASDRRGAGGTSESDSYIAEILAPGGIAAPGFDVDPEQER
jgi:hypothetical protein